MTDSDPRGSGELTDAQLDQLLAETSRELLEHIEATSDPSRALTTIMTRSARQARAGRKPGTTTGTAAAIMRHRIRALAFAAARVGAAARRALSGRLLKIGCAVAAAALIARVIVLADQYGGLHGAIGAAYVIMLGTVLLTIPVVVAVLFYYSRRTVHTIEPSPGQALTAIMTARSRARGLVRLLDAAYHSNRDEAQTVHQQLSQALVSARHNARGLARDRPATTSPWPVTLTAPLTTPAT